MCVVTDKPCELQCVARDGSDVEMLGGFVADGTPCRQSVGARDMCIAGKNITISIILSTITVLYSQSGKHLP